MPIVNCLLSILFQHLPIVICLLPTVNCFPLTHMIAYCQLPTVNSLPATCLLPIAFCLLSTVFP
ncbi:MAG: hypothetical protein EBR30_18000 [Cytophagia bacterium]|nr:hypothetical protein [Cytophagia bacterium]